MSTDTRGPCSYFFASGRSYGSTSSLVYSCGFHIRGAPWTCISDMHIPGMFRSSPVWSGPRKNPGLNTRSGPVLVQKPVRSGSFFCCCFWSFLGGFTRRGRHPLVLIMKFYVEGIQNHVWGPLGAI